MFWPITGHHQVLS